MCIRDRNSIATFLNPRDNPITLTDFNNAEYPIEIACRFLSEEIREVLEAKIKSKIKKADGLDEFLDDILIDRQLTIRKTVATPKKGFDYEQVLMVDYEEEDFQFLYGKSDEELNEIIGRYQITIPVQGRGRNSKLEKIKHIKAVSYTHLQVVGASRLVQQCGEFAGFHRHVSAR